LFLLLGAGFLFGTRAGHDLVHPPPTPAPTPRPLDVSPERVKGTWVGALGPDALVLLITPKDGDRLECSLNAGAREAIAFQAGPRPAPVSGPRRLFRPVRRGFRGPPPHPARRLSRPRAGSTQPDRAARRQTNGGPEMTQRSLSALLVSAGLAALLACRPGGPS